MKSLKLTVFYLLFATATLSTMEREEITEATTLGIDSDPQEALFAGIEANDPELVTNALEAKANVNAYNKNNERPLAKAIDNFYKTKGSKESLEIVHYLLKAGADLRCVKIASYINKFDITIEYFALLAILKTATLGWAINQNIYPLVKLLYEFGANPHQNILTSNGDYLERTLYVEFRDRVRDHIFNALRFNANNLEYKKDWAKIGMLLFPNLHEEKTFKPCQTYLMEILKEVRSDLLSPLKPTPIFKQIQQRQLNGRFTKKSEHLKPINQKNGKQEITESNENN